ncbi:hypothetical protein [uncultured Draconibacterium sp.]|uniref:hypothetical protein n=1 Tax=uncultured Draconibacterium sp. TaxID=1573823 RepID=UPI0025F6EECD|nr:hypothetical protein [uncultured Draconibacterium sp.]
MKFNMLSIQKIFVAAFLVLLVSPAFVSCSKTTEIVVQEMQMELPVGDSVFKEIVLPGEIADMQIEHLALKGPIDHRVLFSNRYASLLIFIKGNGRLVADTTFFELVPESIAIPLECSELTIKVNPEEELHFIRFSKKLTDEDLELLKTYPNEETVFFTRFEDCEAYTEKIKSPNTVSRTVLPEGVIPRVALGTVEAPGPDEVGAHKHPMLDQLFLGLTNNHVTVHADGASAAFKEYSLLHIPIGSSHWVSVDENKKMHYMWMDFFLTIEGQEWLKTHKPISTDKNDY